jgi:hypothetical protein
MESVDFFALVATTFRPRSCRGGAQFLTLRVVVVNAS